MTGLVLIFISEGGLLSFLGEYVAMRNNNFNVFGFSADSVLKFRTEIDIFIKFPQNENFSISSTDYPV